MMRLQQRRTFAVALLAFTFLMLLGTGVSDANSITYDVARTIGQGSVTGTIQTDGTLGILGAINITDWNLFLSDGSNTFNLTGPLSGNDSIVLVSGMDVSATATQFLYDFSASDGFMLFQQGLFSGNHYYCAGSQGSSACFPGESNVPLSILSPGWINIPQTGSQVIGTVAGLGASQVPEPSTNILMLTGLGLLIFKQTAMRGLLASLKKS